MSEPAPASVPGDLAEHPAQALTPAAEAVLADFRAWLADLAEFPPPDPAAPPAEPVDLHTIVAQLTAVRHEVNLQTRAARNQQEQAGEALRLLAESLEALRRAQAGTAASAQQSSEEAQRPLLKALVDLYDALSLAEREARRVQEAVLPSLAETTIDLSAVPLPPLEAPPRGLLARMFGVRAVDPSRLDAWKKQTAESLAEAVGARLAERAEAGERVRQMLNALLTGYRMGLERVDRALAQHGLEPITPAGEPFDPEQMEVVEAVVGSGRPPGEVLDEVRRGYLWRGRVFRFAQVRVARS